MNLTASHFMKNYLFLLVLVGILFNPIFINTLNASDPILLEALTYIQNIETAKAIPEFEPLQGGMSSSRLFKVKTKESCYVIRVISHRSLEDKRREIEAQMIASIEEVGVRVFGFSESSGWIVMEYLPPEEIKISQFEKAKKLGQLLKRLHSGASFTHGISFCGQIKTRLNKIKAYSLPIDLSKIEVHCM